MSFEYTITVKDVYGTDSPEIPEGWELTGEFRPCKAGETVLDIIQLPLASKANAPIHFPRLILRRKKVRKVIFTEIRRDSQPEFDEWFLSSNGRYEKWNNHLNRGHTFPPTTIYRREEVEE